jgi:hypothetical protein
MRMRILVLFALMGIVAVTVMGCRSFTSPARQHDLEASKGYWLDYDASRRGLSFLSIGTETLKCLPSRHRMWPWR